jgi:hypothetical protein
MLLSDMPLQGLVVCSSRDRLCMQCTDFVSCVGYMCMASICPRVFKHIFQLGEAILQHCTWNGPHKQSLCDHNTIEKLYLCAGLYAIVSMSFQSRMAASLIGLKSERGLHEVSVV